MCELCSDDPKARQKAEDHHQAVAFELETLSQYYLALAYNRIKPHTKEAEAIANKAKGLIRTLVEDWV